MDDTATSRPVRGDWHWWVRGAVALALAVPVLVSPGGAPTDVAQAQQALYYDDGDFLCSKIVHLGRVSCTTRGSNGTSRLVLPDDIVPGSAVQITAIGEPGGSPDAPPRCTRMGPRDAPCPPAPPYAQGGRGAEVTASFVLPAGTELTGTRFSGGGRPLTCTATGCRAPGGEGGDHVSIHARLDPAGSATLLMIAAGGGGAAGVNLHRPDPRRLEPGARVGVPGAGRHGRRRAAQRQPDRSAPLRQVAHDDRLAMRDGRTSCGHLSSRAQGAESVGAVSGGGGGG